VNVYMCECVHSYKFINVAHTVKCVGALSITQYVCCVAPFLDFNTCVVHVCDCLDEGVVCVNVGVDKGVCVYVGLGVGVGMCVYVCVCVCVCVYVPLPGGQPLPSSLAWLTKR